MANFYNRVTGEYRHSFDSSKLVRRKIVGAETQAEATGVLEPIPGMEDWIMDPDISAVKTVPLPYWKPTDATSKVIIEKDATEKATVDTARDVAQGKTEFPDASGTHYAFVGQERIDLIACHTIRNETVAKYPMDIKSSDGKTITAPDVGTLESLFNKVFGLTVPV